MKTLFIFLILICSSAFATREEAQTILDRFSSTQETSERLKLISKSFLGLPYGQGGPLGEGNHGRYDQDPLYRFDTFDCTTFVETIISLALTRHALEFEMAMDEIRYEDSEVDYLKRNHFPSLQWIPNNVKNGLLKEINHLVLPDNQQITAVAVINLPGWLRSIKLDEIRIPMATIAERSSRLEELHALSSSYFPIEAKLKYLPISTLVAHPELLKKIPNGSIVNFVRPNWDLRDVIGTHMNVSHQGFIFIESKRIILRHASTTGKVKDDDFLEYLKKFENHPTLKGIHLMQVRR